MFCSAKRAFSTDNSYTGACVRACVRVCVREREIEIERYAKMDAAQLVRLPNENQLVICSTPTFHSGI